MDSQSMFWLAGLVFAVAGVSLFLLLYLWMAGPEQVERTKSWQVDEPSVVEWMEASVEAEQAFERGWRADPSAPDVFQPLDEAIRFQYKLKAIDPDDSFGSVSRLENLLQRLEDTKGRTLYSKTRANVEKAQSLESNGDSVSALALLEEALQAQEWINSHLHGSDLVDLSEAARIRQWMDSLRTVDAAAEVDKFHEAAKTAFAAGRWDEASELFERAIVLQESINLNMPESSYVRWRLVQELRESIRRIEAARMNERVTELVNLANTENRTENLKRALDLQELVNERFPNSEFYNPDRVESLRKQLISDLSEANVALLAEQIDLLDVRLREQAWDEVKRALLELEGSLEDFGSRFSLSLLPDPSIKDRVDWMINRGDRLEALVYQVQARLIDHPDQALEILATEVDQGLYVQVMEENPSRWRGERHPVDSVSIDQAQEFCRKLGWVLGKKVVLPRLEWLAFVEVGAFAGDRSWLSENSQFKSQPVGTSKPVKGLYDLYGNMAEWVTSEAAPGQWGLHGGSGADSWQKIQEEPVTWVAPNFRSRWAGFRFCVLD